VAKLSKEDKIEIIIEAMIENPGARHRRGFQKKLVDMFDEQHSTKLDQGYCSRLVKEAVSRLDKNDRHFMSKQEYQLQYQRLVSDLKGIRDRVSRLTKNDEGVKLSAEQMRQVKDLLVATRALSAEQRMTLREMAGMDGHLKTINEHHLIDDGEGKSLEDFYDEQTGKPDGKPKGGEKK
jgi:hypothetical protein